MARPMSAARCAIQGESCSQGAALGGPPQPAFKAKTLFPLERTVLTLFRKPRKPDTDKAHRARWGFSNFWASRHRPPHPHRHHPHRSRPAALFFVACTLAACSWWTLSRATYFSHQTLPLRDGDQLQEPAPRTAARVGLLIKLLCVDLCTDLALLFHPPPPIFTLLPPLFSPLVRP